MMSVILVPSDRARIASIVEHAFAHPYVPGVTTIPGLDSAHVIRIGRYRCVFSITKFQGRTFRHFSISCIPNSFAPSPVIAAMLAREFGFEGDVNTWVRDLERETNAGVFAQEIMS